MNSQPLSHHDGLLLEKDAAHLIALQAIQQLMQVTHYDKNHCMVLLAQQFTHNEPSQDPLLSQKESEFIHTLFI